MTRLISIWRGGRLCFAGLAGWLALHGVALAQKGLPPQPKQESSGGGSYVLPYVLTFLGVGLGLFFILRSSRRRDRERPEDYSSVVKNPPLQ